MGRNVFAISFYSVHYPGTEADRLTEAQLSEESRKKIYSLYDRLDKRMITAKYPDFRAAEMADSIFGICLPEGYVMVQCTPYVNKPRVTLDGFFIPYGGDLRTAWKTVRWQLLFICAAGWSEHGTVKLAPEDVMSRANSYVPSSAMQQRLVEMGRKLISSDCPVNFAMTQCSRSLLPLSFGNDNISESANSDQVDCIVLDQDRLMNERRNIYGRFNDIREVRLFRTNDKNFYKMKLDETETKKEEREFKKRYKDEMEHELRDKSDLWCLRVLSGERSYTYLISDYGSKDILKGEIGFNKLYYIINDSIKEAVQSFSRVIEEDPEDENPSGGFFGRIFNKK